MIAKFRRAHFKKLRQIQNINKTDRRPNSPKYHGTFLKVEPQVYVKCQACPWYDNGSDKRFDGPIFFPPKEIDDDRQVDKCEGDKSAKINQLGDATGKDGNYIPRDKYRMEQISADIPGNFRRSAFNITENGYIRK